VIVDDISLPFGTLRLKGSGSAGTHNGLGHIQQLIGQQYARLRMGIGNDFPRGAQIDYVLGEFSDEESQSLEPVFATAGEIIKSFVLSGVDFTMNQFNKKKRILPTEHPDHE
jgi:PTH1 family peptidyl-tRNA hydrolase